MNFKKKDKSFIKPPFLSIIIPTRDRPGLIEDVLYSLSKQTSDNFEIILSDNFINLSCKKIFKKYQNFFGKRLIYLKLSKPLGHCDHWDFALKHARGEYVSVLMDKYMLYSQAVSKLLNLTEIYKKPDMVSWWCEDVIPTNQKKLGASRIGEVTYTPNFSGRRKKPEIFDPKLELKRRRNNAGFDLNEEQELYFRAKIVSGMYKKTLIDKIVKKHGRLFPPYAPDYTSITLGLKNANKCLDANMILAQYVRSRGTGNSIDYKKFGLTNYLRENKINEKYYNLLPIPGLYRVNACWIAWCYYIEWPKFNKINNFKDLNYQKLFKIIELKFKHIAWDNKDEKIKQKKIFDSFVLNYNENTIDTINIKQSISGINIKKMIKIILKTIGLINLFLRIYKALKIKFKGERRNVYDKICQVYSKN
jgi:glycosyltransferase involved in cell wall biosynthesis